MASDDVSLPDLEVIAQFSLAVRAATAPRAQVVAALEADLRALTGEGGRAPRRASSSAAEQAADGPAPRTPAKRARQAPAKRAPAKRAAAPSDPAA